MFDPPTRLLCPWISKARTQVDCHFFLKGIFLTQGSNLRFLLGRQILCLWATWEAPLKVKVKSCLTLCDPMDYNPPGSSIHAILQARVLEWVAISFSEGSSWPRDQTRVSHIVGRRFTIWATAYVINLSHWKLLFNFNLRWRIWSLLLTVFVYFALDFVCGSSITL